MTQGVIRERLGFTRAEWDALPWHEARGYLEYLEETAARAAGRDPDQSPTAGQEPPPRVEEPDPVQRALDAVDPPAPVEDYDPADDDAEPLGPAVLPVLTFDDPPPAAPARARASWLPALPIKPVAAFGDTTEDGAAV